jgi:hypothetical protein
MSKHQQSLKFFTFAALTIVVACSSSSGESEDETNDELREDVNRAPVVVTVPIRFTHNDLADVGYAFSSSWVPFTDVRREKVDGHAWGPGKSAQKIQSWLAPDMPGAGYATAKFRVEIPYAADGQLAYGLARVKLESEFLNAEVASSVTRKYSPLRVFRGDSAQPCLSVTMTGGLEGKLKAVPVPFTDENFTERDWKVGDVDVNRRPIQKVIVATLNFGAFCYAENVEGKTHVSGGAAVPGVPAFAMIDKSAGQGSSERAVVHVNLVENDRGEVSVGESFSTNGGILGERDRRKFDEAVTAAAAEFRRGVERAAEEAAQPGGVIFP